MNDVSIGILAAVIIHGSLFYCDLSISPKATVEVKSAPSSIEISLVAPKPKVKTHVTKKTVVPKVVNEKKEEIAFPKKTVEKKDTSTPTPEKEKQNAIINTLQGALTDAKPIQFQNEAPLYPRIARERGYEGVVLLKVVVRTDGSARTIEIEKSSGYHVLDTAAIKAVQKWHFTPAHRGTTPLESTLSIPIVFRLK